jgi:hypothetical protein
MAIRFECRRCWKTSPDPTKCCGAPMSKVSLDEGIFWPFIWLPPQGVQA